MVTSLLWGEKMSEVFELVTPSAPRRVGHVTNEQILYGVPLPALDRLRILSPEQFEDFVLEWIDGHLSKKYVKVMRCSGAGDKGRDVVAYIDPLGTPHAQWDNYQCKHYGDKLTPSEFLVEIGKLCYYTYIKAYTVPNRYYLVTSAGIGPALARLFESPEQMRAELLDRWDKLCEKNITRDRSIPLTGEFLDYVRSFDMAILEWIPELELIKQHQQTRWHAPRFGGGLTMLRPQQKPVSLQIQPNETRYVEQLFAAYSDHLDENVLSREDIAQNEELIKHFDRQRVCFYSAESLKHFERDALPDNTVFEGVKEELYQGVADTCYASYSDGYERVQKTVSMAQKVQISSNPLSPHIKPQDRTGLCHHLANEDRLKWVRESGKRNK
jgi:hypothetical protein